MARTDRLRLTDTGIARLRPREQEYTVWDTRIAGLGVRVRPTGKASFVLLRKDSGRSRRVSLGPVASTSVEEVRRHCHAVMADPDAAKPTDTTRDAPLFRDFVAGPWRESHFSRYKAWTQRGVRSALSSQLLPTFGETPLDRITREQVLRWFDAHSRTAPGGANRVLGVLRQILNHALACGHIDTNPARGLAMNRRIARTRFLSRDELRRLHGVLDEYAGARPDLKQQADMIRLLLLTGCRRGEIRMLRWSEVDGDTLALADSKTGPRTVRLSARARRIIECQPRAGSAFVFPSPRGPNRPRGPQIRLWDSVRRAAGIEDVRLHDLRHSFASHAVMNGVPVPVVSRLLGHRDVRMTLRYAHLADKEIEAAAERIGMALARVMSSDQRRSCC